MKNRVQSQNNYVQPLLLSIFVCPKQFKCCISFLTSAAKSHIRLGSARNSTFSIKWMCSTFLSDLLLIIIVIHYFDNWWLFTKELTQFSDNSFPSQLCQLHKTPSLLCRVSSKFCSCNLPMSNIALSLKKKKKGGCPVLKMLPFNLCVCKFFNQFSHLIE